MSKPMSEQMQKLADRYEKATGKKFGAKTNAQKIRDMSDKELAKLMRSMMDCVSCGKMFSFKYDGSYEHCLSVCLEWLQQPAEEDDHAICGATNLPCIRCNPGGCNNRKEGTD